MKDDVHGKPSGEELAKLLTGELSTLEFERIMEGAQAGSLTSDNLDFLADLVAAIDKQSAEEGARQAGQEEQEPVPRILRVEPPETKRRELIKRTVALAAGLAALVLGIYWLGPGGTATPAAWDLEPPRYVRTFLRNDSATLSRDLARAMVPYDRSEFGAATESLRAFLHARPGHVTAQFYLAASLEVQGKESEARSFYRRSAQDPGVLGDHALWRLAHIHLVQAEWARARVVLQELEERDGVFAANASGLLAELEPH